MLRLNDLSDKLEQALSGINFTGNPYGVWWKKILLDQISGILENMQVLKPWYLLESAPENLKNLIQIKNPSLVEISKISIYLPREIKGKRAEATAEENAWFDTFLIALEESGNLADARISMIDDQIFECDELSNIEWDFLYDKSKQL